MRRNRQNDKFEHWVMNWAVKDEVLGSILGSKKQKVFFHLKMTLLYRLSIPICFITNQFTNKSRNPFNKGLTNETVNNSIFRRTDIFNKSIETLTTHHSEENAKTAKRNREHA